jgi:hypothetical protein
MCNVKRSTYLKSPGNRPKTQPRYIGPYYIVRRSLHGNYTVKDEKGLIWSSNTIRSNENYKSEEMGYWL